MEIVHNWTFRREVENGDQRGRFLSLPVVTYCTTEYIACIHDLDHFSEFKHHAFSFIFFLPNYFITKSVVYLYLWDWIITSRKYEKQLRCGLCHQQYFQQPQNVARTLPFTLNEHYSVDAWHCVTNGDIFLPSHVKAISCACDTANDWHLKIKQFQFYCSSTPPHKWANANKQTGE